MVVSSSSGRGEQEERGKGEVRMLGASFWILRKGAEVVWCDEIEDDSV